MKSPRIFSREQLTEGLSITPSKADLHYLTDVLRLGSGASVIACDQASGKSFVATLEKREPGWLLLIGAPSQQPLYSARTHSALIPPPKGERLDWACEKLCELGVQQIVLYRAERSVVTYTASEAPKKLERLARVLDAAARQSGRARAPQITYQQTLSEAITAAPHPIIYGSFGPDARTLREIAPPQGHMSIAVGPEGGFTEAEEDLLRGVGGLGVTLGPFILRVETAAITAVAAASAAWGDLSTEPHN